MNTPIYDYLVKYAKDMLQQLQVVKDNINNNYGKNNLKDPTKKIITFGYGFYKQEIPLISKYSDAPPSLMPYDKFYEKFNSTSYEKMKQSSFIHFCMRDFTGFNKNYKHIYIVDHNVAQDTEIGDFFHEYHNYNFHFYHTPTCNSIEEYERIEKFSESNIKAPDCFWVLLH